MPDSNVPQARGNSFNELCSRFQARDAGPFERQGPQTKLVLNSASIVFQIKENRSEKIS